MWSLPRCFFGGLVTGLTLMAWTQFPPEHPKDDEEDARARVWQQGFLLGFLFSILTLATMAGLWKYFYGSGEEVLE